MTGGKVILTCAVTGEGRFNRAHPSFPITPEQIASAAIDATRAGASIVHVHARNPETGNGSRDPDLFAQSVSLIRESGIDIVLNLSAGMGGTLVPDPADEQIAGLGSDVVGIELRLAHVKRLLPEMCTLDLATLNVEPTNEASDRTGAEVYLNTTRTLRAMAERVRALGVKPELEVFGPGDLLFAKQLISEGLVADPPLVQFVLGVKWGAPSGTETMLYLRGLLPPAVRWAAFGIGRDEFPMLAQALVLGGDIRVGLEDNLYLRRGVFATNEELVTQAVEIANYLGYEIATPAETRTMLRLRVA